MSTLSSMKRVHITGKMTITFRQHIDVPEDEIEELLSSQDNITCNVDLDRSAWEVEEWDDFRPESQMCHRDTASGDPDKGASMTPREAAIAILKNAEQCHGPLLTRRQGQESILRHLERERRLHEAAIEWAESMPESVTLETTRQ